MTQNIRVGDIVRVRHGGTPSKSNPAFWTGEIPWVSPKDFSGANLRRPQDFISENAISSSAACIVPAGTILAVARSGVLAHSFPVALADRPLSFNQDIKALIPDERKIDPRFLHHFLRSAERDIVHRGVKRGATVHSLHAGFLEGMSMRLPSLTDQRRIVEILDRVAGIRRLRRQAHEIASQIIPALFNKMFGDPGTNPMGWPVRPLGEVIAGFEGGRNLQADAESGADGVLRILKVSAVTSGRFQPEEAKPAPPGYIPPAHHFVQNGDLLISRANTAELVGATALVHNSPPSLLLPDKIWRILWRDPSPVTPNFLLAWFKQPAVRAAMSRLASGTSASMRNISQGRLSTISIILPPIGAQHRFAEQSACHARLTTDQATGRGVEDVLAASLRERLLG